MKAREALEAGPARRLPLPPAEAEEVPEPIEEAIEEAEVAEGRLGGMEGCPPGTCRELGRVVVGSRGRPSGYVATAVAACTRGAAEDGRWGAGTAGKAS